LSVQNVILKLQEFWAERGCYIASGYDTEVGAGTMSPDTFFRVLGRKPWQVAFWQPSRRPDDGRYAQNPNRVQKHNQFQVILKPAPADGQLLFLDSLIYLGVDIRIHDIKFDDDNWASPSLGAVGGRLAGDVRRPGDHPVHLLPAGRRHRAQPELTGDHVRHRAPGRLSGRQVQPVRPGVGQPRLLCPT